MLLDNISNLHAYQRILLDQLEKKLSADEIALLNKIFAENKADIAPSELDDLREEMDDLKYYMERAQSQARDGLQDVEGVIRNMKEAADKNDLITSRQINDMIAEMEEALEYFEEIEFL